MKRPLVLLLLTLAPLLPTCTKDVAPPVVTTTSPATITITPVPGGETFELTTLTIKDKPFAIEIADTERKHAQGLMTRPSIPADHGMLFIFSTPDTYSFWMKNTLIPLDIIYLDANARVLEVHRRKPLDETGQGPKDPALFVVELNAGTADAIGLKPGDTIPLPQKYLKATPSPSDKKN